MRNFVYCFGLVLTSIFYSTAQAEEAARPKIQIEPQNYDFGAVVSGSKVEKEFEVKNIGTSDLTVQKVVAACGCTATSLTQSSVTPGQSVKINVSFDSSGFSGSQVKAVRIFSNDPDNAISIVTMKGTVEPLINVEPSNLFFDTFNKSNPAGPKELSIRVKAQENIKIVSVETFSKFILLKEVESGDSSRKLSVSIDPSVPVGDFRDRIVVNLSGGQYPNISIPVFAAVKSDYAFNPPSVSFGVIAGKEILTRRVKFETSSAEPYLPKSVESSDPAVKAELVKGDNPKSYWISVTLDPSKVDKDLKASLSIVPQDSSKDILSLNVYGVLPPKL